MPVFEYTVDGESQSTPEHTLTATQILANAGIDVANHYLVQVEGNHQTSYKDNPGQAIHMHQHAKFISVFKGETTVS